jgi:hypothetical protein
MTRLREKAEKLGQRIVDGYDLGKADPYHWFIPEIEQALREVVEEIVNDVEHMTVQTCMNVDHDDDGNHVLNYKSPSPQEQIVNAIKAKFGLAE